MDGAAVSEGSDVENIKTQSAFRLPWIEQASVEKDPRYRQMWFGAFRDVSLERTFIDTTTRALLPVFLIVGVFGLTVRICAWTVFYPPASEVDYAAYVNVFRGVGIAAWALFLLMTLTNLVRAIKSRGAAHIIGHDHLLLLKIFLVVCLAIEFLVPYLMDFYLCTGPQAGLLVTCQVLQNGAFPLPMALSCDFIVLSAAIILLHWPVAITFISLCFAALLAYLFVLRKGCENQQDNCNRDAARVTLLVVANWVLVVALCYYLTSLRRRTFVLILSLQERVTKERELRSTEAAVRQNLMVTRERALLSSLSASTQELVASFLSHRLRNPLHMMAACLEDLTFITYLRRRRIQTAIRAALEERQAEVPSSALESAIVAASNSALSASEVIRLLDDCPIGLSLKASSIQVEQEEVEESLSMLDESARTIRELVRKATLHASLLSGSYSASLSRVHVAGTIRWVIQSFENHYKESSAMERIIGTAAAPIGGLRTAGTSLCIVAVVDGSFVPRTISTDRNVLRSVLQIAVENSLEANASAIAELSSTALAPFVPFAVPRRRQPFGVPACTIRVRMVLAPPLEEEESEADAVGFGDQSSLSDDAASFTGPSAGRVTTKTTRGIIPDAAWLREANAISNRCVALGYFPTPKPHSRHHEHYRRHQQPPSSRPETVPSARGASPLPQPSGPASFVALQPGVLFDGGINPDTVISGGQQVQGRGNGSATSIISEASSRNNNDNNTSSPPEDLARQSSASTAPSSQEHAPQQARASVSEIFSFKPQQRHRERFTPPTNDLISSPAVPTVRPPRPPSSSSSSSSSPGKGEDNVSGSSGGSSSQPSFGCSWWLQIEVVNVGRGLGGKTAQDLLVPFQAYSSRFFTDQQAGPLATRDQQSATKGNEEDEEEASGNERLIADRRKRASSALTTISFGAAGEDPSRVATAGISSLPPPHSNPTTAMSSRAASIHGLETDDDDRGRISPPPPGAAAHQRPAAAAFSRQQSTATASTGKGRKKETTEAAAPENVASLGLSLPVARLLGLELGARIGLFDEELEPEEQTPDIKAVRTTFVLAIPLYRDFYAVPRSWQELTAGLPPLLEPSVTVAVAAPAPVTPPLPSSTSVPQAPTLEVSLPVAPSPAVAPKPRLDSSTTPIAPCAPSGALEAPTPQSLRPSGLQPRLSSLPGTVKSEPGESDSKQEMTQPLSTLLSIEKPRVLVVDDEPVIVRIHSRYCERLGFSVSSCLDGSEVVPALTKARDEGKPFDIIILDLVMTKVHGDQASRMAREWGFEGFLVCATANAGPGDRDRLLKAGFDTVLEKPFYIQSLAAVLSRFGFRVFSPATMGAVPGRGHTAVPSASSSSSSSALMSSSPASSASDSSPPAPIPLSTLLASRTAVEGALAVARGGPTGLVPTSLTPFSLGSALPSSPEASPPPGSEERQIVTPRRWSPVTRGVTTSASLVSPALPPGDDGSSQPPELSLWPQPTDAPAPAPPDSGEAAAATTEEEEEEARRD